MNPCSQAEKAALVKVLNEADLDPATGTQGGPSFLFFELIFWGNGNRGCSGTPVAVSHPAIGIDQEGYQGCSTELLYQELGSVHGRDQVSYHRHSVVGLGLSNAILPAQRSSSTPKFHL
jgi:hypothetical protein